MSNKDKIKELNKLMEEHPEAEIITLVSDSACNGYNYQVAIIDAIYVDSYVITDKYGLSKEDIHFQSEFDNVFDIVSGWCANTKVIGLDLEEIVNGLEWVECIVMTVEEP